MRIRARHYAEGSLVDVVCTDGVIAAIEPPGAAEPDVTSGWIAPAFFDLQINGCYGRSFNSPRLTPEDVRHVVATCRAHGIAAFCPTLVTASESALLHAFDTLRAACDTDAELAAAIPKLHLEGPYLSPHDGPRGAHPREHIRPPEWDEFHRFQDAAGGRIGLVTLAPEWDGALPFIERLVASGVTVAVGHTAADGPRLRDAVAAGATLSTHLGNGCSAVLPRHPNVLWEQLALPGLWASLITDGRHIPSAFARCVLMIKKPHRTILTCDASSLAGLPPGRYAEWGQELEVRADGAVVIPGTDYLAGSGAFTDRCVAWTANECGATLADAVDMAGARPRELLGLNPRPLSVGSVADLILFDWEPGGDLQVHQTLIRGASAS